MSELRAIRAAHGEALAELGEKNKKAVALDSDLAHATMTATFADKFLERFLNAGTTEANMIDMAAGLSIMGHIPLANTFAVFGVGRVYDQVRNGCAYPDFNVKLCMTYAGITLDEDNGSHQATEDLVLMRVIPGMTVVVPYDAEETRRVVMALADMQGPAYLRLARLPSPVFEEKMPFTIGRANVLREDKDVVVFAYGIMVATVFEYAEKLEAGGISITVVNMHTVKPVDRDRIIKCTGKCSKVVTVEEHSVIGGLGDAVGEVLLAEGRGVKFKKTGINDIFGQSSKPEELLEKYGLSENQICRRLKEVTET